MAFWRLVSILKRKDIQILHAHVPEMGVIGWLASKFSGVKVVCFNMCNPIDQESAAQRFWLTWSARLCDHTICVTHSVKRVLRTKLPRLSERRISVIHDAVLSPDDIPPADEKTKCRIREEAGCEDGEKLLVCVGRLTAQKGHTTLLKTMRILLDRGHSVKLALVGDGILEQELRRLATTLHLDGKICWMGRREDIYDILQSADLFISTSVYEGFGIAILEAMAAGVPVVAPSLDTVNEFAQNGESSLLVTPGDPTAFAEAVERVITDSRLALALGGRARDRVKEGFTKDVMSHHYQNVYRMLLQGTEN